MEHGAPDGESSFNNRPQEKLKQRSLLLARSKGSHREVKAECKESREAGLGAHVFIRVCGQSGLGFSG